MNRIALNDGRWFDRSKATKFEEDTFWNGNNHVSKATRSPHDHEALYRTAGGKWILNWWSQWQGSVESWEEISDEEAARWLVANGEADSAPTDASRRAVADLEVA